MSRDCILSVIDIETEKLTTDPSSQTGNKISPGDKTKTDTSLIDASQPNTSEDVSRSNVSDNGTSRVAPRTDASYDTRGRGRGQYRDSGSRDGGSRPNAWARGAPRGRGGFAPRGRHRGGEGAPHDVDASHARKPPHKEKQLPTSIDQMPKYEQQKSKVVTLHFPVGSIKFTVSIVVVSWTA